MPVSSISCLGRYAAFQAPSSVPSPLRADGVGERRAFRSCVMTTRRIGVIGLGQRIAHVLAAMKEVGWDLRVDGYVDPAPVGAPILDMAGILPGRAFETPEALL